MKTISYALLCTLCPLALLAQQAPLHRIERQAPTPIRVLGARYFASSELLKILDSHPQAESAERELIRLYRQNGFQNVQVTLSPQMPRRLVIREGDQRVITTVTVEGSNDAIRDAHTIREYIYQRLFEGNRFLKPIDPDEGSITPATGKLGGVRLLHAGEKTQWMPYDPGLLYEAAQSLEAFYQSEGYLSARVLRPKVRVQSDQHFVEAVIPLLKGPKYTIRSVNLDGPNTLPKEAIRAAAGINVGDVAKQAHIESAASRVEEWLWNNGYADAKLELSVERSEDSLDVAMKVSSAVLTRVSDVRIYGLKYTRPENVEALISLKAGDVFSLQQLLKTRQRLFETDVFSRVELTLGDEGPDRPLIVQLTEQHRTTLDIGAGASLEDGPRVQLFVDHRNFLGRFARLKGRLKLNYPALFYGVSFLYPKAVLESLSSRFSYAPEWLRPFLYAEGELGVGVEYGGALMDVSASREIRPAFTLNKVLVQLKSPFEWGPQVRLGPALEYEFANFNCPSDYRLGLGCGDNSSLLTRQLDKGEIQMLQLGLSGAFDGRPQHDRFVLMANASVDVGLGKADLKKEELFSSPPDLMPSAGPIRYLKGALSLNAAFSLTRFLKGKSSLGAGWLYSIDGAYVPLHKRFYLGGTNSVRGFFEDQILPADDPRWPASLIRPPQPSLPTLSLGGSTYVAWQNELRVPIISEWEGAVFFDAGELLEKAHNFRPQDMALASGFGLRYKTPVGPLALDVGFRIRDGTRDLDLDFLKRLGLHFSIGFL